MSSLPTTTTRDARWDCGGCTACCRHFDLGPVSDAIVDGLEARGVRTAWAPAADGFAVRRPGPDGTPAWYFRRRDDGACLFLQQDGLCAIHARWGAEAKPAFCREYPFTAVDDVPTGTRRWVVRADCGGWAESFDTGTPTADQISGLEALPRLHAARTFDPDAVALLPGVGVGATQWPTVDRELQRTLDALPETADLDAAVAALRGDLHTLLGRPAPTPEAGRVRAATTAAAQALAAALGPAVQAPPGDDPEHRGQTAFLTEVHTLVTSALARLQAPDGGDGPPPDARARAYQRLVVRAHLDGRSFVALGGLPHGLGTLVLAGRLARAASDGDATAATLGRRMATFVRFTRHPAARALLRRMAPAILDLFLHAESA